MALKAGLEVRFLAAPGEAKIDPDVLFLERGLAAYEELRSGARGPMEFACAALLPDPGRASAEQKARAAQGVREIVNAAESHVVRAAFLKEAAALLRVTKPPSSTTPGPISRTPPPLPAGRGGRRRGPQHLRSRASLRAHR